MSFLLHKKFTWADFGGYIPISPRRYAPAIHTADATQLDSCASSSSAVCRPIGQVGLYAYVKMLPYTATTLSQHHRQHLVSRCIESPAVPSKFHNLGGQQKKPTPSPSNSGRSLRHWILFRNRNEIQNSKTNLLSTGGSRIHRIGYWVGLVPLRNVVQFERGFGIFFETTIHSHSPGGDAITQACFALHSS